MRAITGWPVRVLAAVLGVVVAGAGPAAGQCTRWENGPFTTWSFNSVDVFAQLGSRLIIGGDFQAATAAGGQAVRVAAWDGAAVTALGSGMNGRVRALKSFSAFSFITSLVAGGEFTTAGGVSANRIAIWSESTVIGAPPPAWAPLGSGFNGSVNAIERFNNQIYAGGSFTLSGTTAVSRIARFNGTTQAWEPLGTGLNGTVFALKVYDGALYAGGSFTTAGGINTGGLAKWNGSAWSQVSGAFPGSVFALEVFPVQTSSYLMVGGTFTFGVTSNLIAWEGTIFVNLIASGGTNGPVRAFAVDTAATRLYAGGEFSVITGRGCGNTAILNPFQGGGWEPLLGGTDGVVLGMRVFNGEAVTGGAFNVAGGISRPRIARFIRTGAPWIVRQPLSVSGCPDAATFTCREADGYAAGRTYQWRRDNVPLADGPTGHGSTIVGAAAATLTIQNARNGDEGSYTCRILTPCGGVLTAAATLRVCETDGDCNGQINPSDVNFFINVWFSSIQGGTLAGDFDHNGAVEPADVAGFIGAWFNELGSGC